MKKSRSLEGSLLRLMQAWRHGRATRSIWDVLFDGYYFLFVLIMFGAMAVNLVLTTQRGAASCDTLGCTTARSLLPWTVWFAALALAAGLAQLFGPVLASAAEGFWLLDAPIRRQRILCRRLWQVVFWTAIAGLVCGLIIPILIGSNYKTAGLWAVATGMGAAAVMAVAAAQQGANRSWLTGLLRIVGLLGVVASLGLSAVIGAGLWRYQLPSHSWIVAGLAGGGAVVLSLAYLLARRRLRNIRRQRLQSGGALVSGLQGAAFALDLGLMRDILVEREAQKRGFVNPTFGRGEGLSALFWRDVQRILRRPKMLVPVFISTLVPYIVVALGLQSLAPLIAGLVLCYCLIPLLQQMRVLTRTSGLIRMFPYSTPQLRRTCMAAPALVAVIWVCCTMPAFAGLTAATLENPTTAMITAILTATAGLMGAVRWVTAGVTNYQTPMLATGAGALPPGLITNLFRGFDMVALITFSFVFNLPIWLPTVIAVFVFMGMSGQFDMRELSAVQAASREELERQKALHEKVKISRSSKSGR